MSNSYKRIEPVKLTTAILRHLAEQREPVSGQSIADALNRSHSTIMCYLATLEDEGMIRSIGGCYELGTGAALIYARYRSLLEGKRDRIDNELKELEVN